MGWWLSLLEITNLSGINQDNHLWYSLNRCKSTNYYTLEATVMKWNVKLYVGGQVFTESVNAINYQDAKTTALARNPKARFIGANASFKDD